MTERKPLPDEMRASVAAASLERTSRFFDASLEQVLEELFQNARRAGATGSTSTSRDRTGSG